MRASIHVFLYDDKTFHLIIYNSIYIINLCPLQQNKINKSLHIPILLAYGKRINYNLQSKFQSLKKYIEITFSIFFVFYLDTNGPKLGFYLK